MRIVTWNCNMAFRNKRAKVLGWDPDVLVIQEAENPNHKGSWNKFTDWAWIGDNPNKGLAIFTRNGHAIDPINAPATDAEYVLPVTVAGRTIVGVWAMNDKSNPEQRYIGQVHTALQDYSELVNAETIVAGDFNWNVQWDESPKSPLVGGFADVTSTLNACGLMSAYHGATDDELGEETKSTFFMHKKQDRPYHTDYIFAPSSVIESDAVRVGHFNNWIDASDHMPVMLDTSE
ncbi:endonuclease/exonuclease/phosphatase family protein [Halocalculus aciditolerans]|uniref:Endonuclease/exonuclease/phosphatase family protein n=1 Tax=Halocalculus aciditolerans TaxID=1383812 RepID=A0A830FMG3_9EURY|nr:endonuclease/exonuclease/phosphatase family protein [Halocalculus aciditolerans]GGL67155.1 endonuclease/exonuclease/phosphatase family protein [Halocalculus aciditolerans]